MKRIAGFLAVGVAVAAVLWGATSIKTAGNIETSEQLVSTKATGTAPLVVSSTTLVANLNADRVDGIEGTDLANLIMMVQDQVTALGAAKVPRTGQSTCYNAAGAVIACAGTGQDAALQLGVVWPNPRFTSNNGTVTDKLTGLIWLGDANCNATVGGVLKTTTLSWADALTWTNALAAGKCGLTDGSIAGAWRLPNVRELQSLMHYGFSNPAVPNTAGTGKCLNDASCAFLGVQSSVYWSSSTLDGSTTYAWFVNTNVGLVFYDGKAAGANYVWPVRGGQ